jgi:hypothetical protein
MSTARKIDFTLFAKAQPVVLGGGVLSADQRSMLSDRALVIDVVRMTDEGTVYWVSNGDWSMHELLMALLDKTGPAKVYISSYAMGETPSRMLAQLKESGAITQLYCVLDNRVDVRTAGSLQLIQGIADKYALISTHAKVTVVENQRYRLVVIGSSNYTENERFEAGVISNDPQVVDLHIRWIDYALEHRTA